MKTRPMLAAILLGMCLCFVPTLAWGGLKEIALLKLPVPQPGSVAEFEQELVGVMNGEEGTVSVRTWFTVSDIGIWTTVEGRELLTYTVDAEGIIGKATGVYEQIPKEEPIRGTFFLDAGSHVLVDSVGNFPEAWFPISLGSGFELFGTKQYIRLGEQWEANELWFSVSASGSFEEYEYLEIGMVSETRDSVMDANLFLSPKWPFVVRAQGEMKKEIRFGVTKEPETRGIVPQHVPGAPTPDPLPSEPSYMYQEVTAELVSVDFDSSSEVALLDAENVLPLKAHFLGDSMIEKWNVAFIDSCSAPCDHKLLTAATYQVINEVNPNKDWYMWYGHSIRKKRSAKATNRFYFRVGLFGWRARPSEISFAPPGGTGPLGPATFSLSGGTGGVSFGVSAPLNHPGTWHVDFWDRDYGDWKGRYYEEYLNLWLTRNWGDVGCGVAFEIPETQYRWVDVYIQMDTNIGWWSLIWGETHQDSKHCYWFLSDESD